MAGLVDLPFRELVELILAVILEYRKAKSEKNEERQKLKIDKFRRARKALDYDDPDSFVRALGVSVKERSKGPDPDATLNDGDAETNVRNNQ